MKSSVKTRGKISKKKKIVKLKTSEKNKIKLQIPTGSKTDITDKNLIRIRITDTLYWVQGERKRKNIWDLYMVNPQTTYKKLIKKNMTTKAFAIFTNMTLKTPFPYRW